MKPGLNPTIGIHRKNVSSPFAQRLPAPSVAQGSVEHNLGAANTIPSAVGIHPPSALYFQGNPYHHLLNGVRYLKNHEPDQALNEFYLMEGELSPEASSENIAEVSNAKGVAACFLDLGLMDFAIANLQDAVERVPYDTIFLMNLANAYTQNGDYEKAKALYEPMMERTDLDAAQWHYQNWKILGLRSGDKEFLERANGLIKKRGWAIALENVKVTSSLIFGILGNRVEVPPTKPWRYQRPIPFKEVVSGLFALDHEQPTLFGPPKDFRHRLGRGSR